MPKPVSNEYRQAIAKLPPYLRRLIASHGLECHWCGITCDPTQRGDHPRFPTREHLLRKADGGSNQPYNLRIACRLCNTSRHNQRGWRPRRIAP